MVEHPGIATDPGSMGDQRWKAPAEIDKRGHPNAIAKR